MKKIKEILAPYSEFVLSDDEKRSYPTELAQEKLHAILVPKQFGGELTTLEDLFPKAIELSEFNLTTAIAIGQCLLGSLPVWIGGDDEQKKRMANSLLSGGNSCLALTEKDHGSDLSASEVFFENGKISGEKWCINNATIGKTMTVLANSPDGLVVLFVDKERCVGEFKYLDKIKTHGIRGADISGISFESVNLGDNAIISRPGKGLEVVAKTMQVSRTMCAAFSAGSLKASLELALDFSRERHLYNTRLDQIEAPAALLYQSYLRYLVIKEVGKLFCRFITEAPEVMSLYSAAIKFLAPTLANRGIELAGEVLGARGYLQEEAYAKFEKIKRDHSVVGLFDGSSAVNLFIISGQVKNILRHLNAKPQKSDLFSTSAKEYFSGDGLKLSNRGADVVFSHYYSLDRDEYLDKKLLQLKDMLEQTLDPQSYLARVRAEFYSRCLISCAFYGIEKIDKRTRLEGIREIFEQPLEDFRIELLETLDMSI